MRVRKLGTMVRGMVRAAVTMHVLRGENDVYIITSAIVAVCSNTLLPLGEALIRARFCGETTQELGDFR